MPFRAGAATRSALAQEPNQPKAISRPCQVQVPALGRRLNSTAAELCPHERPGYLTRRAGNHSPDAGNLARPVLVPSTSVAGPMLAAPLQRVFPLASDVPQIERLRRAQ